MDHLSKFWKSHYKQTEILSKVKCQNCEFRCSQKDNNAESILGYEGVKRRITTDVSDKIAGYIYRAVSEYSNFKFFKPETV
jgi:hypothetical protein